MVAHAPPRTMPHDVTILLTPFPGPNGRIGQVDGPLPDFAQSPNLTAKTSFPKAKTLKISATYTLRVYLFSPLFWFLL